MAQINHQGNSHTEYTVSRVIRIGESNLSDNSLREAESQLPGISGLELDKQSGNLTVAYDSATISFSRILSLLEQAGIRPVDSRWFRLKAAWYDYTDRIAAEQAHARPKGCCNKIPEA